MEPLNINELVILNKYWQNLIKLEDIFDWFTRFDGLKRRNIIFCVWGLAVQAKVSEVDIEVAMSLAGLKLTHTPVIILCNNKTVLRNRGYNLLKLSGKEQEQAFKLVLECFAIAERRRKTICDSNEEKCSHWWHEDLSNFR